MAWMSSISSMPKTFCSCLSSGCMYTPPEEDVHVAVAVSAPQAPAVRVDAHAEALLGCADPEVPRQMQDEGKHEKRKAGVGQDVQPAHARVHEGCGLVLRRHVHRAVAATVLLPLLSWCLLLLLLQRLQRLLSLG